MIDAPLLLLGRTTRDWVQRVNPWTNVYGLSRSLLAIATAGTLLFNNPHILFHSGSSTLYCAGPSKIGIFCLLNGHLVLAKWLALVGLALVASGWRPRITGVLHWWIAFSFQSSSLLIDGGDQIAAILALLLLPVTLTDRRPWQWTSTPPPTLQTLRPMARVFALSALLMIRLQVAGIYFHSAVAKLSVDEWSNGTALYYWFSNPRFGLPPWRLHLVMPLLTHATTVTLMTWGAIVLELLLFMALVMPKRAWGYLLVAGIAFHLMIALTFGLVSFALTMSAALILYLRPVEMPFALSSPERRASSLRLKCEAQRLNYGLR